MTEPAWWFTFASPDRQRFVHCIAVDLERGRWNASFVLGCLPEDVRVWSAIYQ